MHDDHELDPVARLRAADPAAGVEPREGFAADVIARATEAGGADAGAPAPVADLASERARRRPRWLAAVGVAASIAIVGGAGYGVGALAGGGGGSSTLADDAAPPISLPLPAEGGAHEGALHDGVAQDRMMAGSSTDMLYPYGGGRNRFSSSGLGTEAGTALAYGFDARSASNAETVGALAAALGVEGAPELRDGSWFVGPQDGSGPTLSVGLDGTLSFYYSDPRLDPWQCIDAVDDVAEPCEPSGELPGEDAAIDALRNLIASTGRDAAAFEYTSETWEGAVTRMAQAWPVVDGQRIDQGWSLELAEGGVFSASGSLAAIVALGDYAVVSEQEAFERLSDPRFGAQMTTLPIALREMPVEEYGEWVPPTEPPATPTAGAAVSWPVNDVEIVDARLGLASQWQPDGGVLVVPAYEFTDAGGGTWSVIAVADSSLDFAGE